MTANGFCEKCGARISSDAAQEVCPACLLESGLGLLGDESEDAADHEPLPRGSHGAPPVKMLGDFGDYQLLEEIGRGGQGVVYRAHQKSLNRTVALKVIGLGPWTTEAHLKRCHCEAEAAASLEHPCIVPIYEVGECDGSCYFSMKFVDGGQLDEVVKREPIPIRRAVELIAKVARTVHYAHEHGILHRDIKPGNILLDVNSEPHLTDFGLARLVEAESTVTGTLEVMGTPSYMAPEQAAGEHTKLSRAIDVYGLGAVLYQLLTGHPPFAGGTTYETIRLLLSTEPRQPRLWNRNVDREVSTICLKCLEKDPKRRYSSAVALAEDLEHWLKHEPIQAKRSGFFTHARKWVQRNPAIAALIASLAALAAAMGWNVWEGVLVSRSVTNGIAVLPFENLSHDPDNAYFANGIQGEILTRLASIADLKVISRISTQQYQSNPRNLAEIAKQLGVANILEGSVQKVADRVRVTVRLINAQSDSQLWAETYDRKLIDVFGVESDIAKAIAESLQAKVSSQEQQLITAKPTQDPDAYVFYLRANHISRNPDTLLEDYKTAEQLYMQAIALDPDFAPAHAQLASVCAEVFHYYEPTEDWKSKACTEAQIALRLQPNLAEAHFALGQCIYWMDQDYDGALEQFDIAARLAPSNGAVARLIAAIKRRQGKWEQSIEEYERVARLDPQNPNTVRELIFTNTAMRRWPEAAMWSERMRAMAPASIVAKIQSGYVDFWWKGDTQLLKPSLDNVPAANDPDGAVNACRWEVAMLNRDYSKAKNILQTSSLSELTYTNAGTTPRSFFEGCIYLAQGDNVNAQKAFELARPAFEAAVKEAPASAYRHANLGWLYGFMGRKEDAIREGRHAVDLKPESKDAVDGALMNCYLALIYARVGEKELAIPLIARLLKTPGAVDSVDYSITVNDLKYRWEWDPIRSDPRFQKLCQEKQP